MTAAKMEPEFAKRIASNYIEKFLTEGFDKATLWLSRLIGTNREYRDQIAEAVRELQGVPNDKKQ